MSTPRTAFFLPSFAGGGAERVIMDIAAGFAQRGETVDLVVAKDEGELRDRIPDGVRPVVLGARRTASAIVGLVRYLAHSRPVGLVSAVYHANVVAVAAHGAAGGCGSVVVTEHLPPSTWLGTASRLEARAVPPLLKAAYARADGVVAVSQGVADDLAQVTGLARDTIRVIYNPVLDANLTERAGEVLDDPWFAPHAPPVILGVGRLTPQKDFATLVRAAAEVRQTRPCRLLILGEGEERARLESLVQALGMQDDVRLPGFMPNPYPCIRRAGVLALSSRWEGLPTVLLEALLLGTPVVSTDCPSGPAEILVDGQYGRLVPVGDVAAFARALTAVLDEPRRTDQRQAMERFEIDRVVAQYAELLAQPAAAMNGRHG